MLDLYLLNKYMLVKKLSEGRIIDGARCLFSRADLQEVSEVSLFLPDRAPFSIQRNVVWAGNTLSDIFKSPGNSNC